MENDVVIKVPEDCGNSPKAEFLKRFNVAFAKGDAEAILSSVSDDISWEIVGHKTTRGKLDFKKKGTKIKTITSYMIRSNE